MGGLRQLLTLIVGVGLVAVAMLAIIASFTLAVAVVAPLAGLAFLAVKLRQAQALWASRGRFQLPEGVRVIGVGRARALGSVEALSGAGGLALACAPTLFVFGPRALLVPAIALGLALQLGCGVARRRLSEGAQPIDVLPPEE